MEDLDRMVRERTQKLREEVEQRARVQEALRVSEERFSKAFSFSPMPMAICARADNRFLDANASFFRLAGYPAEQLLNRTLNELKLWDIAKPSTEKGGTAAPFVAFETSRFVVSADGTPATVALEGGVRNQPAVLHGRDGSNRHIVLWTEPITLGTEACLLIIAEDVTEQLRLESQLRQSQKMEAVGCLAAGIAHEFNNLLTVIQGHAGLLGSPGISQSCATESVERITQASQRAASLTRRLLSFSRKQPLQLKPLDLSKAVHGLQKMLGQLLGEHYRLELDCPSELPTTRADGGNIEQVLINLTLNARDAMPGGGAIRIATSDVELDQMAALQNLDARPGRFIRLAVSDSGCGMTPDVLRRIFDPFYTTKEIGKGTGLGLSTVQAIVQQHHGWIEVESRPGHGSTFKIFLPALTDAPASQPKIETTNQTSHYSVSGETILVVEDEDSVRGLARLALEQAGYHVMEAADGQEALKVWDRSGRRIDLLLTDMVMPNGLSGNGLAKALLARDPKLRTVYTTGYSSEAVREGLSLRNGVNFLPKPYDATALLKAVKASLKHPPAPAHTALPETSLGLVACCAK
jgi:signal transduction histidine kinase/ActR/RegA family two-component response regulator